MKIELTKEEAEFLLNHLAQLNVSLNSADAANIVALGQSCIMKLQEAMKSEK